MKKEPVLFFILFSFDWAVVSSISYEEDVSLTLKEKQSLDKFKLLVIPKIPTTSYIQNYVKDDLYFIRWLRASQLSIPRAEDMFVKHLKWRELEKMDKMDDDGFDWVNFNKDHPLYFNDTVDKEGRPASEVWFGEWNVRRSVISGLYRQMARHFQRLFETLTRRVYKARAEGKHISQAVFIADVEGFNVYQMACPACLPLYVSIVLMMENQYPLLFDTAIVVNIPSTFEIILRLIRPILSESNRNALKTYSDRNQGLRALDKKIAKNQRSVRFGGTLVRDEE